MSIVIAPPTASITHETIVEHVKLVVLFMTELPVDREIREADRLLEYDLDDIDVANLLVSLESHFEVEFEADADADPCLTVGQVIALVERALHLPEKSAPAIATSNILGGSV